MNSCRLPETVRRRQSTLGSFGYRGYRNGNKDNGLDSSRWYWIWSSTSCGLVIKEIYELVCL